MMNSIRCILLFLLATSRCCITITALTVISVCQNKDCCQRFTLKSATLGQTLDHLLHHGQRQLHEEVQVKTTGCLGNCGKGPNIQIDGSIHRNRLVSHLDTPEAAAVALKELDFVVHPTLLAATNVMERSSRAKTVAEQDLLLTSVISALAKKEELATSHSMAHAHALRAAALGNNKEDAMIATTLNPHHPTAWRILADAEEADHNVNGAMEALKQWATMNPLYETKVSKEIERLRKLRP